MLLDEPTNHLDIKSKNVLKAALNNFEGTLIIVSHDRDFLDGLADTTYEFQNKNIKEYLGDINFFLETKVASSMRDFELKKENIDSVIQKEELPKKDLSFESQKKLKMLNNQLGKVERDIQSLEKDIKNLEEKMLNIDQNQLTDYLKQYNQKKQLLDQYLSNWESVSLEIDVF
jgi:ATP-binding cassette subfamily F protein 3